MSHICTAAASWLLKTRCRAVKDVVPIGYNSFCLYQSLPSSNIAGAAIDEATSLKTQGELGYHLRNAATPYDAYAAPLPEALLPAGDYGREYCLSL